MRLCNWCCASIAQSVVVQRVLHLRGYFYLRRVKLKGKRRTFCFIWTRWYFHFNFESVIYSNKSFEWWIAFFFVCFHVLTQRVKSSFNWYLKPQKCLFVAVKKNAVVSMSCEGKETRSFGVDVRALKVIKTEWLYIFWMGVETFILWR